MVDRGEQLDAEWKSARANFRGWLLWYRQNYPDRWPTQRAMADDLGITEGRLSQLLDAHNPTEPKLKILLAAKRAFQSSIDHLLTPPPGSAPPAKR